MSTAEPLAGRGILITRPATQAQMLADKVRAHGGRPLVHPAIEIRPAVESAELSSIVDKLASYDLAVFVSPNAVDQAAALIRKRRALPLALCVAGVGGGTARRLRGLGFTDVVEPASGADSEALLATPRLLRVAGQHVVIFRGVGGRELLTDELTARGARVDHAECYERVVPALDRVALTREWTTGAIDAAVFTSSEGLRNFYALLAPAERDRLAATPLFVSHPRIAAAARSLRLDRVQVTGAGDEAVLQSLCAHFARPQ